MTIVLFNLMKYLKLCVSVCVWDTWNFASCHLSDYTTKCCKNIRNLYVEITYIPDFDFDLFLGI